MQCPKKDRLKTVGIIALMIGGYALFVYRPGVQQRSALQAHVATLQTQTQAIAAPDLEALRQQADEAQARFDAERTPIPQENEVFLVLDGMTRSLEAHGITDHTVSQSDPRRFADYCIQPVLLEFTGDFAATFAALRTIEQLERPLRIDRLELIGDHNDTSGHITAVVQLSAFFSQEQGHE